MSLVTWAIIAGLIAINAFYVAAEFAIVGVRRTRIGQLANEGNWSAKQLLPVLTDPARLDRYVAACQIGITVSSLVLGAYSQATLAVALQPWLQHLAGWSALASEAVADLTILLAMTVTQVLLGELVPKSLALQFPGRTAMLLVVPMQASVRLLTPFITFLNGSGQLILRATGLALVAHRHVHSPEEIDLLLVDSRDGGLLEPAEHLRLHRALRLSRRTAHELMVPRVRLEAIALDTAPDEALQRVMASPYTRLPVYRETLDNIVGVLHTQDMARHVRRGAPPPPIAGIMRPVAAVPETLTADKLLATMRERRTHQLLVLDQFGGVAGLVTLEDVLGEMLGGGGDEMKAGQATPERLADGRVRLPGAMRADEATVWLGFSWEGEASTVGGLVTHAFGRLPLEGERIAVGRATIEVERMQGNAVATVLVSVGLTDGGGPHG